MIIGEVLFSWWKRRQLYRLNDSVNDLSMGIYSQLIGVIYRGIFLGAYIFIYENWRIFTLGPDSIFAWIFGFFAVDFLYYWFHRNSHEISVIWGSHEPHHQSEEYNLSVALRQGSFQGIFSGPYYFPLALIGLHPVVYLTHSQFNTIYQFWIHTRAVGKLGFLELFLNTPSHHRVHHGRNPKYIDKNHAGTLIIWDKMFGTFQEEEEEPVYGTVKPLESWNPLWANLQYWLHLARLTAKSHGIWNKIKVWVMPPGWKPEELGGKEEIPEIRAETVEKYDPPLSPAFNWYVLVQFLILISFAFLIILQGTKALTSADGWIGIGAVILSLMILGWLMEKRSYSLSLEVSRVLLFGVSTAYYFAVFKENMMAAGGAIGLAMFSVLWLVWSIRPNLSQAK